MHVTFLLLAVQKRIVASFEVSAVFALSLLSFDPQPLRAPAISCVQQIPNSVAAEERAAPAPSLPQIPMTDSLWRDLRKGLHYLESSNMALPPDYVHPGGVAFGELGLSAVAVKDVMLRYPQFSGMEPRDVFKDPKQYECFARYYADLLLRHYCKLSYWEMPEAKVFEVLQKAWFLGPTLYRQGKEVIPSREMKAQEFMRSLS